MITLDKIKDNVSAEILELIDTCDNVDILKTWLVQCEKEILSKQLKKENTYSLCCERDYLKLRLS